MDDYNQVNKQNFIYQHYQYLGKFSIESLVFNTNLQEFSQRVSYICNLQTGGKLSLQESYQEIEALWQQLADSFNALGIEKDSTNNC